MLKRFPKLSDSWAYFHLALGAPQGKAMRRLIANHIQLTTLTGQIIKHFYPEAIAKRFNSSLKELSLTPFQLTPKQLTRSFASNPFDKLFRRKNFYPEDEIKFENLPTRPLEKEDAEFQAYLKKYGPTYPIKSVPLEKHYLNRDPNAKWDFPAERRNFGEPVPWNYDTVNTDLLDPMTDTPLWRSLVIVGGFVGLATALVYGVKWFEDTYLKQLIGQEGVVPRIHSVPVLDDLFVDEKNLVVEKYLPYAN
jgi:hypothetical protein